MSVSDRHIKEKSMIRRVYENQHGIITLDSDLFGSRKRISTGKKSDKRLLKWYEKHFDEEYEKLFNEKFQPNKDDFTDVTPKEYGELIINLTSENRRKYVHEGVVKMFQRICDFQMSDDKKFGKFLLTDIKIVHIMKWQKECGYSYYSLVNYRGYLNMVLQAAMNDDLIRKNPVSLVKLPKKTIHKESVFYDEDDIKSLISHASGQLKNYIQLCCFSGMRGSELSALRWKDDIDFEKGVIRVDTRICHGNEDLTKSSKTRFIPMFPQSKDALMNQRMRTGLGEFVFIDKHGGSLSHTEIMNTRFKRMIAKHGLKYGTIHDLRRSFNTLLKQHGYPIDWILDIMGHMNDAVNRNHYTGHLKVDLSKIAQIAL
jgi:integrase